MRQYLYLIAVAVATWAFCGAVMMIGRAVTSLEITLAAHLILAPLAAAAFSWPYFRAFAEAGAAASAAVVVATALILDAALVAPVFERSYAMFQSPVGLWIPMALIFAAVFATGRWLHRRGVHG